MNLNRNGGNGGMGKTGMGELLFQQRGDEKFLMYLYINPHMTSGAAMNLQREPSN